MTERRVPMPIGTVVLHCWGTLKNRMPCQAILFSGTVLEFKGEQRFYCRKCHKWTVVE